MKRSFALIIALLMLFASFAGCTPTETGPASSEGTTSKESVVSQDETAKRIFFSNAYYTAPYCAPLNEAVKTIAEENGFEITIVDGEGNADKQLAQFKTAVAEGYDGIIYFPSDAASTPPVVEYLNSTDVTWMVINTPVDPSVQDQVPAMVAIDGKEVGNDLATIAKDYFGEDEGKIVYIEGAAGGAFNNDVYTGLTAGLESSSVEILNNRQYADWDPAKAMKIMEDMLTMYGDDVQMVICIDGGTFQGALTAVDDAGKKGVLPMVCAGQDLIVKESLENGSLLGTSMQDPYIEGQLAIETLIKLLNGEEVDDWTKVPAGVCYKEDISKVANWF